jgi:integrase
MQDEEKPAESVATAEAGARKVARKAGQIIGRGEKKWLVRWFDGVDEKGQRLYRSKTIKGSKRDAQAYLTGQLRSQDVGTYVAPAKLTVGVFLDRWLEAREASGKITSRTLDGYKILLRLYVRPKLGGRRLDSVRLLDVQQLVDDLRARGLSPRTVRLAHAALGGAFKQAIRWGALASNPADLVELPGQERKEVRALSPDEIKAFRGAAVGDRHAALFDFMLATGCRPGEALALRWGDLDLEGGRAMIRRALTRVDGKLAMKDPKTKSSRRTIPLPKSVVPALEAHRRAQAEQRMKLGPDYARALDLVFANELGLPLEAKNVVRRHLRPILERAKIKGAVRLYDLRHSHATALLAAGVHPKVAAERLGHATTRLTLDTYTHVVEGMQEEATARIEAMLFG